MSNIDSSAPVVKASQPSGGTDNHTHNYSPVRVNDTIGAITLGVVSLALLIALMMTQSRNRKLEEELVRLK